MQHTLTSSSQLQLLRFIVTVDFHSAGSFLHLSWLVGGGGGLLWGMVYLGASSGTRGVAEADDDWFITVS